MSFQKRLKSGDFVVLAEINTPKGVDISELMTNGRRVKGRIDAVVIPDMDNGVMKMNALAGAVLMHRQGIETIIHVYGRDRNRLAIQSDLLSAYVLGVQNLIVVEGVGVDDSDHRDAVVVDDLDEIGILRTIQALEEGVDLSGFDLTGSPGFTTGCTVSPYTDDAGMEREIEAAAKKAEAGAEFIITPPIFDIDHLRTLIDRLKSTNLPIIPSVFLIKSVGIARYMSINEPGTRISEDLIKRIRKSPDRDMEGIRIAGEMIKALKDISQGVEIITLGWEHQLPAILDAAGI